MQRDPAPCRPAGRAGTIMKVEISSGDHSFEIEVAGSVRRQVRVGDTDVSCDFLCLPEGHYSLILDGRVYDLTARLDTDTCLVSGRVASSQFRIFDRRRPAERGVMEEAEPGLRRICAEMPGKVVRVLVKPGEKVTYDQGLLVLEAMKMQNEIRSPKSGTVREIGVDDGRAVNTGDFLLSIE